MAPKYKPGGKKFPPKSTAKSLPPQISPLSLSSTSSPSSSGLDAESENKFELELCWCIQQLEVAVDSCKLAEKQLRSTKKSLDLLKSNNVALVQKRQIMRSTFGDYRAKMIQEEKKHCKTVSIVKFSMPKPNENKSMFIRKAQTTLNIHQSPTKDYDMKIEYDKHSIPKLPSLFHKNTSSEEFRFNFGQPNP